jgi:hypothetical protein
MKYLLILILVLIIFLFFTNRKEYFTEKSVETLQCLKLDNNDILKIKKQMHTGNNKNIMEDISKLARKKGLSNEDIIKCLIK